MLDPHRLIVPRRLADACEEQARLALPYETGGAFMGSRRGSDLIVEYLIDPGPLADHRRHSFRPDAAHQWAEMARVHRASDGRIGFLGDWHTHPGCRGGDLSGVDADALEEIVRDPQSRAEDVVFAILSGCRRRWLWTGHLALLVAGGFEIRPCAIEWS